MGKLPVPSSFPTLPSMASTLATRDVTELRIEFRMSSLLDDLDISYKVLENLDKRLVE